MNCVLCDKPAATLLQPALGPNGQARQYVTCRNRLCALYGHTLESRYVPTMTLRQVAAYKRTAMVAR